MSSYAAQIIKKPGFICVIDLNLPGHRSVTNDAEKLIEDLVNNRVLYRDTDQIWDEILVKEGRFADFIPVQADSLEEAIEIAKSEPPEASAFTGGNFF